MNFGFGFTTETQKAGIVQRFGQFRRVAEPGLHWKLPVIDRVEWLDLRQQELKMEVAPKKVMPDEVWDAFHRLDDETEQIIAYVSDSARAKVPEMGLAKSLNEIQAATNQRAAAEQKAVGHRPDDRPVAARPRWSGLAERAGTGSPSFRRDAGGEAGRQRFAIVEIERTGT